MNPPTTQQQIDLLTTNIQQSFAEMGGEINQFVLQQIGLLVKVSGKDFQQLQSAINTIMQAMDGDPNKPGFQMLLRLEREISGLNEKHIEQGKKQKALQKALQTAIKGFNADIDVERKKRQKQIKSLREDIDRLDSHNRDTAEQQANKDKAAGLKVQNLEASTKGQAKQIKDLVESLEVLTDKKLDIHVFDGFIEGLLEALDEAVIGFKAALWKNTLVLTPEDQPAPVMSGIDQGGDDKTVMAAVDQSGFASEPKLVEKLDESDIQSAEHEHLLHADPASKPSLTEQPTALGQPQPENRPRQNLPPRGRQPAKPLPEGIQITPTAQAGDVTVL